MLQTLGYDSMGALMDAVVPEAIRDQRSLELAPPLSEEEALSELAQISQQNQLKKSLIGRGYHGCYTPEVIRRNFFENPAWYTAYTPYQPEISQGRLELLYYFQTLIVELTGMDMANASMLDEASAAAEAMMLCHRVLQPARRRFLVDHQVHPQTIDVLLTHAEPLGLSVEVVQSWQACDYADVFAVLVQYPASDGAVGQWGELFETVHAQGALAVVAADLLALSVLQPPASFGADIVVGSSQRFGVPLGGGGPHAAFFAVRDRHKRHMPGRLVGQSLDAAARPAYRLTLQTREQHIRREKATSNICTAQSLLAIMATLYACYHGREGLQSIAHGVHRLACTLAGGLSELGIPLRWRDYFDTLALTLPDQACADRLMAAALAAGYNLQRNGDCCVCIALDQTCTMQDVSKLLACAAEAMGCAAPAEITELAASSLDKRLLREDTFLTQVAFVRYRSETDMMRYLRALADKDIALDRAMIPLGSCTMKLNAAAELAPVSWPLFAQIHPFAPADQRRGYATMVEQMEQALCACTGYDAMSLQPNAGSQGEYAGLLAVRHYHLARGDHGRDICLVPASAHGTNPASAQMAGLRVVVVACDAEGNIDLEDLAQKIEQHGSAIAAIMITYPSTHGVFEAGIIDMCQQVHAVGGQVYIDGANLNALVGLAAPGSFGGDVSHLNLHKTFSIPHGGGGPGVGPIGVREHLRPYLPGHAQLERKQGAVCAAPWGSAGILPVTWMYLRMMGAEGLRRASEVAILNANYIAHRLQAGYALLYSGAQGLVAHECIFDMRPFKSSANVSVEDIAKRLMDYGFHAPTMSFPVPGTLMIEPTESESKAEIDRFCDAMLSIREEIAQIERGVYPTDNNPLCHAPHTAQDLLADDWQRPYSRHQGAYPYADPSAPKYWPPVSRIDNVYGDKHLVCSCPPLSSYL